MPTLSPTREDCRVYEIAILSPYPLPQKDDQVLQKEIDRLFLEADIKTLLKDVWGRRGLAYAIGGAMEGAFTIYYVEALPASIVELKRQLAITKNILRHLIVKPPKHYQVQKYGELYEKWVEENRFQELRTSPEKREKRQKQVLEKAKSAVRKSAPRTAKSEGSSKPKLSKEAMEKEVSKLLTDDSLGL